jgi:hypothetical protein
VPHDVPELVYNTRYYGGLEGGLKGPLRWWGRRGPCRVERGLGLVSTASVLDDATR